MALTSTPVCPGWLDSDSWSRGSYNGCCTMKDSPDFLNLINCIYLWLHRVFIATHEGLSLAAVSGGYSCLQYADVSSQWLLLLQSTGFRSHGSQALKLWRTGLVALRHVGSSQSREGTLVSCTGRRIPNHWTTRDVQPRFLVETPESRSHL